MSSTHQQNRRSWNAVTHAHNSHKVDQAAFLRGDGSTLFPDELGLLGDLKGQDLLHLQCNCGQDSLSLAKLGCQVTGVDISDKAVEFARELSDASGIPATFERDDVLQWLPKAASDGRRFDRVLCSYGTIGWVEDLNAYMRGIASVLRPNGRYVLLEFHPLVWSLGSNNDPYFTSEPIDEASGVNDYVGQSGAQLCPSGWEEGVKAFANPERATSFQWTVADIINAVVAAQLEVERVREYPYANGCRVMEEMSELPGNRFAMPQDQQSMPLMFGLAARKRG